VSIIVIHEYQDAPVPSTSTLASTAMAAMAPNGMHRASSSAMKSSTGEGEGVEVEVEAEEAEAEGVDFRVRAAEARMGLGYVLVYHNNRHIYTN
jgi:hypothetical protein